MKSIVIPPKNKSEFEFVSNLVKKLGLTARTLDEEKEGFGLGLLMNEAARRANPDYSYRSKAANK